MSSAVESELGALFLISTHAIPIRHTLIAMGHPHPPTPIKTDNTTSLGVITNTIKRKRTKAIDMRFIEWEIEWIKTQLRIYWTPGKENLGDYYTKHHPPSHHKIIRQKQKRLVNLLTILT